MAFEQFSQLLRLADVDVLVVHPLPQREESGFIAFAGVVVLDINHASLRLWKQISFQMTPASPAGQ